jgi:hypothetical protein
MSTISSIAVSLLATIPHQAALALTPLDAQQFWLPEGGSRAFAADGCGFAFTAADYPYASIGTATSTAGGGLVRTPTVPQSSSRTVVSIGSVKGISCDNT